MAIRTAASVIPFTATQLKAQKILRSAARAGAFPSPVAGSPPTFVGPAFGVTSVNAAPVAGGTGYTVNDLLTATGSGTLATNGAHVTLKVTSVSGGVVTGLLVINPGQYTTVPSGTVATTGGTGTGCTFNGVTGAGALCRAGFTTADGGQQYLPNNSAITQLSGPSAVVSGTAIYSGAYMSWALGNSSRTNGLGNTFGFGYGFATDTRRVGWVAASNSGASACILYYTDLKTMVRTRAATADYTIVDTTASGFMVDFGTASPRYVEIYFQRYARVRGFDIDPTARIWNHVAVDQPDIAAICDSYGEGQGATANLRVRASMVYGFGEKLGCPGIISNSIAGTGLIATNGGNSNTYGQRVGYGNLDTSLLGNLDVLAVFLSLNDNGSGAAAVQAAVTALVPQLKAAQPNAFIAIFGPPNPNGGTSQAIYDACRDGVAAATSDPLVKYFDTSPTGDPILFGTGKTTALRYDGNCDLWIGSDGVHPVDEGHRYIGIHEAEMLLAWLETVAG